MNSKSLVFLCLFLLQGCGDESTDNESKDTINLIQKNENIWLTSGIKSYTFTYFSSPNDCPTADPYPPVEITVINGSIDSIYVVEFDEFQEVENTHYLTVDQIFESMLENGNSIQGVPSFDETWGYPVSYSIDLSSAECDGISVNISSFI